MVNVEQHRSMCMIGSILALIGVIKFWIFSIIGLVGVILILLGLKGISDAVNDERPFKNYLYSFIVSIVSVVVIVVMFLLFVASSSSLSVSVVTSSMSPVPHSGNGSVMSAFGVLLLIGVIVWIIGIISAYFRKNALKALYELTDTKEFESAATWIWWGALTLIVPILGVILLIVGAIYQILGFSRMPSDINPGQGKAMEEGWVVYDDDFKTEF